MLEGFDNLGFGIVSDAERGQAVFGQSLFYVLFIKVLLREIFAVVKV